MGAVRKGEFTALRRAFRRILSLSDSPLDRSRSAVDQSLQACFSPLNLLYYSKVT
ncbi:MAG: hypothetical protein Kow0021_03610 [Methanothermobacter thermautotrophicus]